MTQRGGKRSGAGRPKGAKDKLTREAGATLSDLARQHTEAALQVLVQVAMTGESEAARVSAANAILDRGYGKPTTPVEHTGKNGGPVQTVDMTAFTIIEEARRLGIDPANLGIG